MPSVSETFRQTLLIGCASALGVAALNQAFVQPRSPERTMLLAPMIGLMEPCIGLPQTPAGTSALESRCTGPDGSAAALVESTLAGMAPRGTATRYAMGYTLNVPLLQLFELTNEGWAIDRERVGRLVRTVRDSDRPVVLYLFSNHFATGAPIEEELAGDPTNLSHTRDGPLLRGSYYGSGIHNWSFASTQTPITTRRLQATAAVLDGICRLDPKHIAKIRAVTLLGELHHLFPDFESGMGFLMPYRVTDYSAASRAGFRTHLQGRFGTIAAYNQAMGTSWASFQQVDPPSKDVRREAMGDFTEHMDSFAHGSMPIGGWVHVEDATADRPARIGIYRNGTRVGATTANLGRQDVLEARPDLGEANTGWRYDLDFRRLPAGMHRIDVYLEGDQKARMHLGTRQVAVMDRQQSTPVPLPQTVLPPSSQPSQAVSFHLDLPADLSSYFYNPLAEEWHAYRARQVVDYLQFYNETVARSCLGTTPRFTHQIIPFTNPGWDANKFAIDASLQPLPGLRLGVSLYGEASYGGSFARWLGGQSHREYAVTEFHPLRPMKPAELRGVLDRHAQQGARFLSFFLEPRFEGRLLPRGHNIFSLDPQNPKAGSDVLYRSMAQAVMEGTPQPATTAAGPQGSHPAAAR